MTDEHAELTQPGLKFSYAGRYEGSSALVGDETGPDRGSTGRAAGGMRYVSLTGRGRR